MDKGHECPLCLEQLEMDDVNFFPCKCGYQICRFCWHRIRSNDNGLCPHCRRHYPENPANFKPLTPEELQQLKNKKKQKDLKKKQKVSECRKQLANIRVVQKNLVFVVGLPQRLVDVSESEKASYFKQFGKIQKLIINTNTTYAGSQGPSSCAYVTYHKPQDAYSAVQAMNNTKMEGRNIKASLGTTKYCSNFLKKLHCPKQDCMYLHEIAEAAASFTKEQIQLGKHLEYEQKLYEQMSANQNHNRKESSYSELTDSDENLHKEKDNCFISVTQEQNNECFQSCSNSQDSSVNLSESNQIPQNQDYVKHSTNHISDQDLNSMFLHCEVPCTQSAAHSNLDQNTAVTTSRHVPCDNSQLNSFFSNMQMHGNFSPGKINQETSSQGQSVCTNSVNSRILEQCFQSNQPEEAKQLTAPSESSAAHFSSKQNHSRWMNSQELENKSLLFNNSEDCVYDRPSSPDSNSFSHLFPTTRTSSLFSNSFSSSGQDYSESLHVHKTVQPFLNFSTNGTVVDENTFHENHDDDLGFDPCQESLEGLKDLITKEEEEAARVVYSSSIKSARSVIPKPFADRSSESTDSRNNFHSPQRFTNPPPGFAQGSFLSSSHSVPSFANANLASNRIPQVMNFQNQFQPIRPQFPINRTTALQNGLPNSISSENRASLFHESYELPSRKSLNLIPQHTSPAFAQPPFPNVGQSSHRSVSPLHHLRSLQHSFNELSMRQLQQNGVKHDPIPYTDQLYATLLRNLQTGYPNGS